MKEKIEVELLDELEHLIDADFLVEVIQKVTESRSFAWSEDLDSTKIEILQWIADFLSEEQSQAYLQFLYTNYGKKIPIEVVEFKLKVRIALHILSTTAFSSSRRFRGLSKAVWLQFQPLAAVIFPFCVLCSRLQ
jgi:hypothetical protein